VIGPNALAVAVINHSNVGIATSRFGGCVVCVCVCVGVCARSARMGGGTAKKGERSQKNTVQTVMGQSLGGISAFESSATQDRMTGAQRRLKCPVTQKFHEDAPVPAL
jgi:hypothetical protein